MLRIHGTAMRVLIYRRKTAANGQGMRSQKQAGVQTEVRWMSKSNAV